MGQDTYKTHEYKGYKIRIENDCDPINPRKEYDNLTKMICFHQKYDLGDEHEDDIRHQDYNGWDEIEEAIIEEYGPLAAIAPLYLYDHGGITISMGGFSHCDSHGWDWGQVGFVFITREDALKEYGVKKLWPDVVKQCEKYMAGDVDTYDLYLTGQCYGYVVEDDLGEFVDSCWAFLGDPDGYILDEAKRAVDYDISHQNDAPHFNEKEETILAGGCPT